MCEECKFPVDSEIYYPRYICKDCALNNKGKSNIGSATAHIGKCGWCKKIKRVYGPKYFGYPEYRSEK